jgi:hypothetical protein
LILGAKDLLLPVAISLRTLRLRKLALSALLFLSSALLLGLLPLTLFGQHPLTLLRLHPLLLGAQSLALLLLHALTLHRALALELLLAPHVGLLPLHLLHLLLAEVPVVVVLREHGTRRQQAGSCCQHQRAKRDADGWHPAGATSHG